MPNIISTGANDEVNISLTPLFGSDVIIEDFNMKVFNRWGNIISESSDISEGWDGYINNQKAENGVYVWTYEINVEECGEIRTIKRAGNVTLLK